jgi:16S rRNA (guanine(966)-N(2))-methyltransferase RsmD
MPVKIIAGEFGGRKIECSDGLDVRPTSSMTREAIFNVLQPYYPFKKVLDLYAGSGALGIEAISRGALHAVLVEKGAGPSGVLRQNLIKLKIADRAKIQVGESIEYLKNCGQTFDLILADPPYPDRCLPDILQTVEKTGSLAENGILVIQHSIKEEPFDGFGGLKMWKSRKYGKTQVSFYRYNAED